jgi:hypothetical protein
MLPRLLQLESLDGTLLRGGVALVSLVVMISLWRGIQDGTGRTWADRLARTRVQRSTAQRSSGQRSGSARTASQPEERDKADRNARIKPTLPDPPSWDFDDAADGTSTSDKN